MAAKKEYRVAVAGATGAVGNEMVKTLEQRNFPVRELVLLASERSEGKTMRFRGADVTVHTMTKDSFAGVDIASFPPALPGASSLPRPPRRRGPSSSIIRALSGWNRYTAGWCLR